jgi:hypothetical protein
MVLSGVKDTVGVAGSVDVPVRIFASLALGVTVSAFALGRNCQRCLLDTPRLMASLANTERQSIARTARPRVIDRFAVGANLFAPRLFFDKFMVMSFPNVVRVI